jgi:hypothetical protein
VLSAFNLIEMIEKELHILFSNFSDILISTHYGKVGSDQFIGEVDKEKLLDSLPEDFNISERLRSFNSNDWPKSIEDIRYDNLLKYIVSLVGTSCR